MPSVIRHVRPVSPQWARGVVAQVYRQASAEFATIVPAVQMASPAGEILAPGWSLLRESQLAGQAPAAQKSLVALGVSQANRCRYDEDARLAELRQHGECELAEQVASGGIPDDPQLAALHGWARASATGTRAAPFAAKPAPEFIGTVLFAHFVNRLTLAMLPPGLSPDTDQPHPNAPLWRPIPGDPRPGDTLSLLKRTGKAPKWGDGSPVGVAYGALAANAARGAGMMSREAAGIVTEVIAAYRGRIQPDASIICLGELRPLSRADRLAARAAILAGLAPAALSDADIAAWRATDRHLSDHCTVLLLAYGAMAAVAHIEADIA